MVDHVPAAFRRRKTDIPSQAPARVSWPRYVVWRLFFTKQNEMDLGYAFVIPFLWLFFLAWFRTANGEWTGVSGGMWSALVAVITTLLLATVPKDRARIMRDRDYETGHEWPAIDPFTTPPNEDAR